ncbi:MAG: ChuX/HutX family heme-like substrate-binding protein [Eikenella sp.]|nr:ChuX/HutX family heme-like substrate-binding protein [Eikenella sp.]
MSYWQQYQTAKAEKDRMYFPREGAEDLGISEGTLMADAPGAIYLGGNIRDIILQLHTLGRVECIVRNSAAVHEKQGVYENVSLNGQAGIALNMGGIDLRIFAKHWHHALAVEDDSRTPPSRSIQFYDEYGTPMQKVFMRENDKTEAWQALLARFGTPGKPEFAVERPSPRPDSAPLAAEQLTAFHQRWMDLKDVHHFGGILESFGLDRQTAYQQAPEGMAVQVKTAVWEEAFNRIRVTGLPVMIFVGNRGLVQIQSGKVHHVVRARGYLNILDSKEEGFSLHLQDDALAQTWVVRRCIRDGFLTCIEGFDECRKTVIQIFSLRQEGQAESPVWQEITDGLMQCFRLEA